MIPCFNAERFVAAAIESVLEQSYPSIELIVVDDGSTDGSVERVQRFAGRGVRLIRQARGSASAARNRAFAASSGRQVLFLDADDLIGPRHIEALAERLGGADDVVATGPWARFRHDPAEAQFVPRPNDRDASGTDWLIREWTGGQPMTQCGAFLIPRALIERRGGWDERLTLIDDFEFFARLLAAAERVLFAPEARLYYRSGVAGSLSGRKSRVAVESAYLSLTLAVDHLLTLDSSSAARRASANILQSFDYEHYPYHGDLRILARARAKELGGADIAPVGPPRFHALRRLVGWRLARRLQLLARR
nr:glycosyltransferase family A protein [Prosthecomicrobium pneumaticum]